MALKEFQAQLAALVERFERAGPGTPGERRLLLVQHFGMAAAGLLADDQPPQERRELDAWVAARLEHLAGQFRKRAGAETAWSGG